MGISIGIGLGISLGGGGRARPGSGVVLQPPLVDAAGTVVNPNPVGTAAINLASPTVDARAIWNPTGTAAVALASPTAASAGAVVNPNPTGTGAISLVSATIAATGSGGQDPSNIGTGIKAWLRSDRGLPGGQSDNTTMASWASQVAGGADCSQSNNSVRPIWHSSGGQNNKPYLQFNGSNGYVWSLDLSGPKTLMIVYKLDSVPGSGFSLYTIKGSSGPVFSEQLVDLSGYQPSTWRHDIASGGAGVGHATALGSSVWHYSIITYDGGLNTSTSSYTSVLDGTAKTVVTSGSIGRSASDLGSLGSRMNSTGQGVAFALNGKIGEVAVWDNVLSAGNLTAIAQYASTFWAL